MSDRLIDRLVSPLARASARKRTYAADETRRKTSTQRHVSVPDEPVGRSDARAGDTTRRTADRKQKEKVMIPTPQDWAEEARRPAAAYGRVPT